MLCREVMNTSFVVLSESDNVEAAARYMREKKVDFIPISNRFGRIVGTITQQDLINKVLARALGSDTILEDIMEKDLISCRPNDSILRLQEKMRARRRSHILCMDADGKLLGVINVSDILTKTNLPDIAVRTFRQVMS